MKRSVAILNLALLIIAANWGAQTSQEPREKPDVNFYGTLKDTSGVTYEVEYITVGHLYSQIPLYSVPKDKDGKV